MDGELFSVKSVMLPVLFFRGPASSQTMLIHRAVLSRPPGSLCVLRIPVQSRFSRFGVLQADYEFTGDLCPLSGALIFQHKP